MNEVHLHPPREHPWRWGPRLTTQDASISRFLVLTWIFLWSRCLAKVLSETLALPGSPALSFSTGIRLVSRVLSLGWKYFRAWKSLWMACPTTILSFKIFRIWKRQKGLDRQCS